MFFFFFLQQGFIKSLLSPFKQDSAECDPAELSFVFFMRKEGHVGFLKLTRTMPNGFYGCLAVLVYHSVVWTFIHLFRLIDIVFVFILGVNMQSIKLFKEIFFKHAISQVRNKLNINAHMSTY